MKVLIVDQSPSGRALLRRLLAEGGRWEFHEAAAAAEGLRLSREASPDCVLIDYKLPDMTGLEFLYRLRSSENGDGPVAAVMLTALASEQVAVDAMKAGAQDYLVKDRITGEGLRLAIAKAVEKAALVRTLKQERDRLARSLAEKEVLIQEVHHRVKNNLQVIASLLRLQADGVGDCAVAEALRRSQHRVESMAQIHEQLYQSGVGQVELARQAGMLLSHLLEAYGRPHVTGRVEIAPLSCGAPVVLSANEAIPAGLVLNELISNALKHGFAGGRTGTITVSGGVQDGVLSIEVRDNGVGVPEGVDIRNPSSLGLQIVGILVRQLKGTVAQQRSQTPGSAFVFRFPARTPLIQSE